MAPDQARLTRHVTINLAACRNGEIVGLLPLVHLQHRVFGRILCSMPFVNSLTATAKNVRRAYKNGASVVSGSEDFKSRWHAQATQLYWYYFRPDGGELPRLNVMNPKCPLAIRAWRHMPL